MVNSVSFEVEGLEELNRQFHQLNRTMRRRVLRAALSTSATKIVKSARKNAPKRTGKLRKAIFKSVTRVGGVSFVRGPQAAQTTIGVKRYGDKGVWYAHQIEYGTRQRFRWRRANELDAETIGQAAPKRITTGRVKAHNFMRKAWWHEGRGRAVERFKKSMQRRIRNATR